MKKVTILGAGLTGATIGRTLAEAGYQVTIFEKGSQAGGHVQDKLVGQTYVSKYGPHTFHTNDTEVWEFANRFTIFNPFKLSAVSVTEAGLLPWPINNDSIRMAFGQPDIELARQAWIHDKKTTTSRMDRFPDTFEKRAACAVGSTLYELLLKHYTEKQWQMPAAEVPPEVFGRVRVKESDDPWFFDDRYEGQPVRGYSEWVRNIVDHPAIRVHYDVNITPYDIPDLSGYLVISTIPPDHLITDDQGKPLFGKLKYLKLRFDEIKPPYFEALIGAPPDLPPFTTPIVNFGTGKIPYTRMTFHHKMHGSDKSPVVIMETPSAYGEELYPVRTQANADLATQYQLALKERGVISAGRLGSFQYLDMDTSIRRALDLARTVIG